VSGLAARRACAAEFLGTALLVLAVVGSGIQAQRLSPDDTGLALLENAIATGAALAAIIAAFGPVSGAHLNPVVTVVDRVLGGAPRRPLVRYLAAQLSGGIAGAVLANVMFGLAPVSVSDRHRATLATGIAEAVATFGLLLVIHGVVRSGRSGWVPAVVAAYITGAYWFTSSTSFANPAVTLARLFSDTFAGIGPGSVAPFALAQAVGGLAAVAAIRFLFGPTPQHCPHLSVALPSQPLSEEP
jgi:glycerol uptake facilitator-like aquaporin